MKRFALFLLTLGVSLRAEDFRFNVLKYKGGGDWYEGIVGAKNLLRFVHSNTSIVGNPTPRVVEIDSTQLENVFFLYATGHGTMKLEENEIRRMRNFLVTGGFLYVNDDYGLDASFRKTVARLFSRERLIPLPNSHPLFRAYYSFPSGPPKIHKHDGGPPRAYGLHYNGRMVILYTHNCDIGDGWAPYQVHKDPEEKRLLALKFGVNIIVYAMTH